MGIDDSGDSSDEEQAESFRPLSAVRSPQSEVLNSPSSNHQLPPSTSSTPSTPYHQPPQFLSAAILDDGAPGYPGQPLSGMLGNQVCVQAPAGHTSFNHQHPLPTPSTPPRVHHQHTTHNTQHTTHNTQHT